MPPQRHADGGTYDDTGWETWPQVEGGDWGLVYVTVGRLRGKFVYYDDSEPENVAIIYDGLPLESNGYAVPLSSLRQPSFPGALGAGAPAHVGQLQGELLGQLQEQL